MAKYTIGIEMDALSGKAVLVQLDTAEVVSVSQCRFKDGIIVGHLPNSENPLLDGFVLQNPQDYLYALEEMVKSLILNKNIKAKEVIGLGISFTEQVMLVVDTDNQPLCFSDKHRNNPHSWAKPPQYSAAKDYINKIKQLAKQRKSKWFDRCGCKISPEMFLPKILQLVEEDYQLYLDVDNFIEASDWLVSELTNTVSRNQGMAGFNLNYHAKDGFPKSVYLESLNPKMKDIFKQKIKGKFLLLGEKAGSLTPYWADRLGLTIDVSVAVGASSFQMRALAIKNIYPGELMLDIGKIDYDTLMTKEAKNILGVNGPVFGGIIPNYYGYLSRHDSLIKTLSWFRDNYICESMIQTSRYENKDVYQLLEEASIKVGAGKSGVMALNWFEGNQAGIEEASMCGLLIGLTAKTKPEEIYRAFLESSAFEKKLSQNRYIEASLQIKKIAIFGKLPYLNNLMLQIYADIFNSEIAVYDIDNLSEFGAAINAAVAAKVQGGYPNVLEASSKMGVEKIQLVKPILENVKTYQIIYQEYLKLRDYYSNGRNDIMKKLNEIKNG